MVLEGVRRKIKGNYLQREIKGKEKSFFLVGFSSSIFSLPYLSFPQTPTATNWVSEDAIPKRE